MPAPKKEVYSSRGQLGLDETLAMDEEDPRQEYLQTMFTRLLNSASEEEEFKRGDIVWAKMRGSSWWPAMVIDASDCGMKNSNPKKHWLFWFGDHSISEVAKTRISPFKENFTRNVCTKVKKEFSQSVEDALLHCKKEFIKSVEEALSVLASANNMKLDNVSVISWAGEGFESDSPLDFRWTKAELPKFIQDALAEEMDTSESDSEDDPVEIVVKRILDGKKSLDDVCIGCCRDDAILVQPHPLFIGKVCKACKKDVDRVNNFPCGKSHRYCIICGQGGNLVYCSKKICRRAFCEECIKYLDSPNAFTKITSIDGWPCYLCKPTQRKNCLIKKRALNQKVKKNPTQLSKSTRQNHSSTASKTALLIDAIWKGRKKLEDVCIACCKENAQLRHDHLLFIGKVCKKCDKDVKKVCDLPPGIQHNFCIVCGQGGFLVYCDNNLCMRAYCKPCINYLDHRKRACQRIVQKKEWSCYFCKPDESCLIRKRPELADIPENQALESSASAADLHETGNIEKRKSNLGSESHDHESSASASDFDDIAATASVWSVKSTPVFENVYSDDEFMGSLASPASDITAQSSVNAYNDEESMDYLEAPTSVSTGSDSRHFNYPAAIPSNKTAPTSGNDEDDGESMHSFAAPTSLHRRNGRMKKKKNLLYGRNGFLTSVSDEEFIDVESANCLAAPASVSIGNNVTLNYPTAISSNETVVVSNNLSSDGVPMDSPATPASVCISNEEVSKDCLAASASNETGDVIQDVLKGDVLLQDICISCRKKDALPLINHPLFVGQICGKCHHDVIEVCNILPLEKRKDFCAICGKQEDSLVKCGYGTCSRAYCKTCVECLDSKDAYLRIVQNMKWLCYVSQAYTFRYDKSLIRQREPFFHQIKVRSRYRMTRSVNPEDVCIACGKCEYELMHDFNVSLIAHHPLFFGSICESCEEDAEKACCLRSGKLQDFCILCGQGGRLVYCSKEECSRAYCEECIDYLDSDKAFNEIAEKPSWLCYFCKPSENQKCLIQQRIPPGHFYYSYKPLKVYKAPPSPTDEISIKLHKREITLQDVCIACFKEHLPHSVPHPLFKGIVCDDCLSDVHKACEICGIYQDECVVCGQGGNLIYCSISLCSRAYCKPCIEHLDVTWAYDKILKNENWFCYFCDLNPSRKCLLKRKADKRIILTDFPNVPEVKYPIAVLASNHTGLEALKKAKIKVKNYNVDSTVLEFMEMDNTDLILGSFLVKDETKVKENRSSLVKEFLRSFSYFNNRRITSCFQKDVFFIFIGDYLIMDADMLSQVANHFSTHPQFCPLLPVLFKFGERKFLAWSNLSACMPQSMKKEDAGPYIDKRQVIGGQFINIQTVEKEIFFFFMKYLQDYFEPT